MSGEAKVVAFLQALEARVAPVPDHHHVLYAAQYGSDSSGWTNHLCLQVSALEKVDPIFIDDGDLMKEVDQLVAEVVEIMNRSAEQKRAAARDGGEAA